MRRINFTANLVGDTTRPGVSSIITRIREQGDQSADRVVDSCLEYLGSLEVHPESREELIEYAKYGGDFSWDNEASSRVSTERIAELLQLIVALREYQYA